MSQLTEIVASVELVTRSLEQTRQGSVAWQRQLAQDVSVIIDQAGGSAGPEIRDCLVAVRSAITAVQQMQASLDFACDLAYRYAIALGNLLIGLILETIGNENLRRQFGHFGQTPPEYFFDILMKKHLREIAILN